MVRIYLVRHAESENNVIADRIMNSELGLSEAEIRSQLEKERVKDPSISARGCTQAHQCAAFLAQDEDLASTGVRLYCSPMSRAMQTAQYLQQALTLVRAPMIHTEIFEIGGMYKHENGVVVGYPGMNKAEIEAAYPGFDATTVGDEGWWDPRSGKETHDGAAKRAAATGDWLRRLSDDDSWGGTPVVMVSHAEFLDLLLTSLLGIMPGSVGWYHDNTGITELAMEGPKVHVIRVNRVDHFYLPLAAPAAITATVKKPAPDTDMAEEGAPVVTAGTTTTTTVLDAGTQARTRAEVTPIFGDLF